MILLCSSAACNCFFFLLIALSVSAYIFVSQVVVSVACLDCSSVAYDSDASPLSPSYLDVGKGQKNAAKGQKNATRGQKSAATRGQSTAVKGRREAVRAFGDKDGGGRFDYAEYPVPEFCDDADGNGAVIGMSLLVMAVCAFLISNTCPEYCFRKRINLDQYKKIVVEKECGCKIEYNAFEEP